MTRTVLKATDLNSDGFVSADELKQLLSNIGAKDKMSQAEIDDLMEELGEELPDGSKGVAATRIEKFWKQVQQLKKDPKELMDEEEWKPKN